MYIGFIAKYSNKLCLQGVSVGSQFESPRSFFEELSKYFKLVHVKSIFLSILFSKAFHLFRPKRRQGLLARLPDDRSQMSPAGIVLNSFHIQRFLVEPYAIDL